MLEDNPNYDIKLTNTVTYRSSVLVQFWWLLWRCTLAVIRDPRTSYIAVFQTIFISVLFGLIFLQLANDQAGIQNKNGILFLMLINSSFSNLFATINKYSFELPIMLREHRDGMYRVIAYFSAKTLIDLPLYILITFLYVTIIYWMTNLNNDGGRFVTCVVVIIFVVNISVSFGKLFGVNRSS